jgi:hypothetical protein
MVLSAIPATAQDIAYGPASYYVDSSTGSSTGVPTATGYSGAGLTITGNFTANFNANFGANAVAAQNAWLAAAQVYMNNYSDPIHVNITVDATAGTSPFGASSTSLITTSYANLRAKVVLDAKTADDNTAIGPGGSMTVADPTGGTGTWWVSRAEAKAIALIADDGNNDGTTTFGAGNPFSFAGTPGAGTYDFQGVCAHEIAEVMGRLGLKGGTIGSFSNSYSLVDNFAYTGAAAKGIKGGPGNFFSIDNGTTLLKQYNDYTANNLDSRDWAGGPSDSFNQFASSGVVSPVSAVDLREMDVIGYDLAVPEPSTLALFGVGAIGLLGWHRRSRSTSRIVANASAA